MERWIGSCRRELLDRTLVWNQRHLMIVLREYEGFCNAHRPHRALKQAAPLRPLPGGVADLTQFRFQRRDRAGAQFMNIDWWHRFSAPTGGPLRPDYLTVTFGRLVKRSGLPPVRLHDLRHGAATQFAGGHGVKVIADQLGHSSVVLTADTYLSVAVELGLKGAAAAARLILSHAGRPPGGGTTRQRSAPPQAVITGRTASRGTLAA